MTLVLPTAESLPTYDGQAVVDNIDLLTILAVSQGTGVVSGCTVSAAATMHVAIAAGVVLVAGTRYVVGAVASQTVTAASGTDRRDIVVYTVGTGIQVIAGTACTVTGWTATNIALPPVKPAVPANSVLLGEIYIPGGTTTITSGMLVDKTATIPLVMMTPNVNETGSTTQTVSYATGPQDSLVIMNNTAVAAVTLPTSILGAELMVKQINTGAVVIAPVTGKIDGVASFAVTGVTYAGTTSYTVIFTMASTVGLYLGQYVAVSGLAAFTTNTPVGVYLITNMTATTITVVPAPGNALAVPTGAYSSGGIIWQCDGLTEQWQGRTYFCYDGTNWIKF